MMAAPFMKASVGDCSKPILIAHHTRLSLEEIEDNKSELVISANNQIQVGKINNLPIVYCNSKRLDAKNAQVFWHKAEAAFGDSAFRIESISI